MPQAARKIDATHRSSGTIDAAEVERFSALAAEWWNPNGKFKPLHKFNPVRLAYIRDAVAAQFILDKVAKSEELGVDQNELSEHIVRRAQQSGQDPQEFANHMFEHNHIPELVQEILRGKALGTIVESATVKDASGNVVDLKNLRPDGTIGEPADDAAEEPAAEA